ncbi:MAG: hypothetical protein VXW22_12160, partial [Pseudomonadota bacterium]|nr:hypothetical protein [Pseudomonadota bacterium]
MWLFLLWWCVDDHLASALNAPGLGTLPLWVPLILSRAFSFTVSSAVKSSRCLPDAAVKADHEQTLGRDREIQWQLLQH